VAVHRRWAGRTNQQQIVDLECPETDVDAVVAELDRADVLAILQPGLVGLAALWHHGDLVEPFPDAKGSLHLEVAVDQWHLDRHVLPVDVSARLEQFLRLLLGGLLGGDKGSGNSRHGIHHQRLRFFLSRSRCFFSSSLTFFSAASASASEQPLTVVLSDSLRMSSLALCRLILTVGRPLS
jgi:hypothetical protein